MSPPHIPHATSYAYITRHQVSKIDLDILAVDQLLKFPSETKNQMAEFYYRYGRANALDEAGLGFDLASVQDMTQLSQAGKWSPYYSDYIGTSSFFTSPLL